MKINKSRLRSTRNTSQRKYKNINKSRKRIKKTHKKYLVRLKKYNKNIRHRKYYTRKVNRYKSGGAQLQPITAPFNFSFPLINDPFGKLMVNNNGIPNFTDGYGNNDDTIITDPIPKDDKSFETWQKNHNTEYQLEMQNSISRNKNLFIKKKSSQ